MKPLSKQLCLNLENDQKVCAEPNGDLRAHHTLFLALSDHDKTGDPVFSRILGNDRSLPHYLVGSGLAPQGYLKVFSAKLVNEPGRSA